MYNRYIPQADGSYRRNRMPSAEPEIPKPEPIPREAPVPTPPPVREPVYMGAAGFLRRLIPKDLDTGDLLVIILLLLMAGDDQEGNHSALLTLALYLFL